MEYSSEQRKLAAQLKERPVSLIEAAECRRAAVCVALFSAKNGPDIILQVRSSKLEEQPGDISLPGGMIEQEETPQQTLISSQKRTNRELT